MLIEKHTTDELIKLFLDHQIQAQQLKELQIWVDAKPENKAHLIECQKIWLLISAQQKQKYNSDLAYELFVKKQQISKPHNTYSIHWKKYMSYASIFLLFILTGSLYWLYTSQVITQETNYFVEVPNGGRTKLYMPDSSEVWLNAGSNLEYSSAYGKQSRTVKLRGEAFFKIAKNQDVPFIVQTDSMDIRVHGTSFNVRNFVDMSTIKVRLLEGRIELQLKTEESSLFLKPKEELTYKKKDKLLTVTTVENNLTDWRDGQLHFDLEPLSDIVRVLERQYNVKIIINNPQLLDDTFYGGFKTEQSIKEIIEIICFSMNINYSVTENIYIIH